MTVLNPGSQPPHILSDILTEVLSRGHLVSDTLLLSALFQRLDRSEACLAEGATPPKMSLTNCRFYEEKYPEVDSYVMVNVKQVCIATGHVVLSGFENVL